MIYKVCVAVNTTGVGRGHKRKSPPSIELEVGTIIRDQWDIKRWIKYNIRDMGHRLENHLHNKHLILFAAILNQIESYGNLLLIMEETFCYATVLF